MAGRLTAAFVRTVTPADKTKHYGDGRGGFGLTLRVHPNGVKHWCQRLRISGRPTNIGLGSYPLVTLAEARATALANARTVRAGGDPRAARKQVPTLSHTLEAVSPGTPLPGETRNARPANGATASTGMQAPSWGCTSTR